MLARAKYRPSTVPGVARTAQQPSWRDRLPPALREMVATPLTFKVFRDRELPAERCFGYDAQHDPCYYAHRFSIQELRSDDDEEFYACTLYGESLAAWRLHDGHWLIHRIVHSDEQCDEQGCYSLSPDMPR